MRVIIPMAGRGSRFSDQGYSTPKPLIRVGERPMVLWALESIKNLSVTSICFVVLQEHESRYGVQELLKPHLSVPSTFVMINEVTEGQLCTILSARDFVDADEDILIAASDTLVLGDLQADIQSPAHYDGIISVADLPGDRWSFARTDESGKVVEVTEKKRISNHASTGLYYFRKGREFVNFGEAMIRNKEKTLNEYYVMPVYQKMIQAGLSVGISRAEQMWDMGTPNAKEFFELNFIKK